MIITTEAILSKLPCSEWTEERIRKQIGSGKTLLQILDITTHHWDRLWCITKFLDNDTNKKFGIWCIKESRFESKFEKRDIEEIEYAYSGRKKTPLEVYDDKLTLKYFHRLPKEKSFIAAEVMEGKIPHHIAYHKACKKHDENCGLKYKERRNIYDTEYDRVLVIEIAVTRKKQIEKLREIIDERRYT